MINAPVVLRKPYIPIGHNNMFAVVLITTQPIGVGSSALSLKALLYGVAHVALASRQWSMVPLALMKLFNVTGHR